MIFMVFIEWHVKGGTNIISVTETVAPTGKFFYPRGMVYNTRDNFLYVSDSGSHTIKKVDPLGKYKHMQ